MHLKHLIIQVQFVHFIHTPGLFRAEKSLQRQRGRPWAGQRHPLQRIRQQTAAPLSQFQHRGFQGLAGFSQFIHRRPGRRRQHTPAQNPLLFQALEPFGKQIGADTRQPVHKVLKAARASQQFADNQQRPAFAHDIQGIGQRAELVIASACHTLQCTGNRHKFKFRMRFLIYRRQQFIF